jgi:predicted nucleic acid-binding protein
MQRRFRDRGGRSERVVADFLIGSHALLQCEGLITRDAAFFRDYFKGLKIVVPKA